MWKHGTESPVFGAQKTAFFAFNCRNDIDERDTAVRQVIVHRFCAFDRCQMKGNGVNGMKSISKNHVVFFLCPVQKNAAVFMKNAKPRVVAEPEITARDSGQAR